MADKKLGKPGRPESVPVRIRRQLEDESISVSQRITLLKMLKDAEDTAREVKREARDRAHQLKINGAPRFNGFLGKTKAETEAEQNQQASEIVETDQDILA